MLNEFKRVLHSDRRSSRTSAPTTEVQLREEAQVRDSKRLSGVCRSILDALADGDNTTMRMRDAAEANGRRSRPTGGRLSEAYVKLGQLVSERDALVREHSRMEKNGDQDIEDVLELVQLTADAVERATWECVGDSLFWCEKDAARLRDAVEVLQAADSAQRCLFDGGLDNTSMHPDTNKDADSKNNRARASDIDKKQLVPDKKNDKDKDKKPEKDKKNSERSAAEISARSASISNTSSKPSVIDGGRKSWFITKRQRSFLHAHRTNDFLARHIVRQTGRSLKDRCVEVLEWSVVREFEPLMTLLSRGESVSSVAQVLDTIQQLIDRVPLARRVLPACFRGWIDERALNLLFESSTRKLVQMTVHFYCVSSSSSFSQSDILKLVKWLAEYAANVRALYPVTFSSTLPQTPAASSASTPSLSSPLWTTPTALTSRTTTAAVSGNAMMFGEEDFCSKSIDELMQNFASGARRGPMLALAQNIFTKEISDPPHLDGQNHYVSNTASDLFSLLNQQVDFILHQATMVQRPSGGGGVSAALCVNIAEMVCDIVGVFQQRILDFLRHVQPEDDKLFFGPERVQQSEEHMCSTVNLAVQCADNLRQVEISLDNALARSRRKTSRGNTTAITATISTVGNLAKGSMNVTDTKSSDLFGRGQIQGKREPSASQSTLTFGIERASLAEIKNENGTGNNQEDTVFDICNERFVEIAVEACDLLTFIVIHTMIPQLAMLFGNDWLSGREPVMDDVLATARDFLKDYRQWLMRSAHLGYIVKGCLKALCAEYVRLFATARRVSSEEMVARMQTDLKTVRSFFELYTSKSAKSDGLDELLTTAAIDAELRVLEIPAAFASCQDAVRLVAYVPLISSTYRDRASTVLEGLLAVTPNLSKQQRSQLLKQLGEEEKHA